MKSQIKQSVLGLHLVLCWLCLAYAIAAFSITSQLVLGVVYIIVAVAILILTLTDATFNLVRRIPEKTLFQLILVAKWALIIFLVVHTCIQFLLRSVSPISNLAASLNLFAPLSTLVMAVLSLIFDYSSKKRINKR